MRVNVCAVAVVLRVMGESELLISFAIEFELHCYCQHALFAKCGIVMVSVGPSSVLITGAVDSSPSHFLHL